MQIEWTPDLSVGEKTIDNQHQKLINQINVIIKISSSSDTHMNQLRDANHFLHIYIKEHFSYEETYMIKNNFPGIEAHKKEHQKFISFYDDFQKEIKEKTNVKYFASIEVKEMLKDIEKFLGNWFIKHIKGSNHKYAVYINAKAKKKK